MNYNTFLDGFFGSGWISFGTLLGLLALGIVFRKPLFINRKHKGWLGTLYFGLFLLGLFTILLINPMCLGYGKAIGVKDCAYNNGQLFVLDYRLAGGGEAEDPEPYYRVHVLDAASGEKQFRFLVGRAADLVLITDETIICRRIGELVFYSRKDGSEIAIWNAETLPKLFPELASGIDNFETYLQTSGSIIIPAVNVTSRDGKSWKLYLPTRSVWGEKPVPPLPASSSWEVEDDHIEKNSNYVLTLKSKEWNDKRKQICLSNNDSVLNPSLFFVEGQFISVDEKDNCIVILHYETTTKERWILTGISLNGKQKLWEIRQDEAQSKSLDQSAELSWTDSGEVLFFTSQDETIAVRMKDGKVLWRTEL